MHSHIFVIIENILIKNLLRCIKFLDTNKHLLTSCLVSGVCSAGAAEQEEHNKKGVVYNEYSAFKPIRTALLCMCGGGTNVCQKTHGLTF